MRAFCILVAATLASCSDSTRCLDMHFVRLQAADRAVVMVDSHTAGELRSTDTLRRLADFAQAHGSGWDHPWYGPAVARLYVEFYTGKIFLGDIGVGKSFLSARGCGYLQSRSIDPRDRRAILDLIGIGDPDKRSKH